mmetsp:Transcript_12928/g.22802  ORF Transcript_12928/g.22802 Transcript_12928/m.22802 type:complete len:95 (-) Transcript_12928:293-577(-)
MACQRLWIATRSRLEHHRLKDQFSVNNDLVHGVRSGIAYQAGQRLHFGSEMTRDIMKVVYPENCLGAGDDLKIKCSARQLAFVMTKVGSHLRIC